MKTILVPVGGSDTDNAVFEAALAVARPLNGHLEFLHIGIGASDATLNTPHIEFARGAALAHALDDLERRARNRHAAAQRHVRAFCSRFKVEMADAPCSSAAVTARWCYEEGDALGRLMFHARHNDLTVMARPAEADGLPPDRLETLLLGSGRPLLIAPAICCGATLGTAMLCWKETPEAARALSAAMPLLRKAQRVVVVGVREGDSQLVDALADLIRQLAWVSPRSRTSSPRMAAPRWKRSWPPRASTGPTSWSWADTAAGT